MQKQNVSSCKCSLVAKGPGFHDWTGAEKEVFLLHASVLRDLLYRGTGKLKRRSLEAFRKYANGTFEDYLLEFDTFSTALTDCVRKLQNITEMIALVRDRNPALAHEFDLMFLNLSMEELYRRWASIFQFPLRFDRPGAEENFDRLLKVNNSRPCFRPSIRLKEIFRRLVEDDDFKVAVQTHFRPSHGPGSVAYRTDAGIKTGRLSLVAKDSKINIPALVYLCQSGGWEYPIDLLPDTDTDTKPFVPSQVISVPKNWKKRRLIAIEDVTLQYYEQGVRRALYAAIKQHRLLRKAVDLERPELNVELAQWGSITGRFATIDLSDASDSVGYRFVEECLDGTWIWPKIRLARSSQIQLPDGTVVENNMFATMGNAICFPIETILFSAICVEALILAGRTYEDAFMFFRVYGDDIIIANDASQVVLDLLARYGFVPNESKTYTDGTFRESCGGEFLGGYDVTPLRVSRKFSGLPESKNSQQWDAWFDLANRFYDYGCMSAMRYAVAKLLNHFSNIPPFHAEGHFGLKRPDAWPLYEESSTHVRFHSPVLQTGGFVVQTLKTDVRRVRRDTVFALIEWLSLADERTVSVDSNYIELSSCEKASKSRPVRLGHVRSTDQLVSFHQLF